MEDMGLITAIVTAVPVIIGAIAIRLGSRQVREFHIRTGDHSLLTTITALSRFSDSDEQPADKTRADKVPQRV